MDTFVPDSIQWAHLMILNTFVRVIQCSNLLSPSSTYRDINDDLLFQVNIQPVLIVRCYDAVLLVSPHIRKLILYYSTILFTISNNAISQLQCSCDTVLIPCLGKENLLVENYRQYDKTQQIVFNVHSGFSREISTHL